MQANKQVNKVANKVTKKIKKVINRKIRTKRRLRRRGKFFRNRRRRRNMMGAAYVKGFKKEFQVLNKSGSAMIVRGRDLIYAVPDSLNDESGTSIMTVIPANPAYWLGTRVAAIASGYQNYKPIMFTVTYVPQCAVTQQGNVIGGTLWSMAPTKENLQQTLKTSNGGMMTQCYKQARSKIALKNNLQFRLYRMGGKFDQESNPFIYIAMAIATYSGENKITPGYFYVSYCYEFVNPIGGSVAYHNSSMISKSDFEEGKFKNISCVNCGSNTVPIGAILQDDDGDYKYNDEIINLQTTDKLWYFCNLPNTSTTSTMKLYYTNVSDVEAGDTITLTSKVRKIFIGIGCGILINNYSTSNPITIDSDGKLYDITYEANDETVDDNFEYLNTNEGISILVISLDAKMPEMISVNSLTYAERMKLSIKHQLWKEKIKKEEELCDDEDEDIREEFQEREDEKPHVEGFDKDEIKEIDINTEPKIDKEKQKDEKKDKNDNTIRESKSKNKNKSSRI